MSAGTGSPDSIFSLLNFVRRFWNQTFTWNSANLALSLYIFILAGPFLFWQELVGNPQKSTTTGYPLGFLRHQKQVNIVFTSKWQIGQKVRPENFRPRFYNSKSFRLITSCANYPFCVYLAIKYSNFWLFIRSIRQAGGLQHFWALYHIKSGARLHQEIKI